MLRLLSLAVFVVAVIGCMQAENSNTADTLYGVPGDSPGAGAARLVLYQNCGNCHAYHTMTQQELVTDGVVSPGNPSGSSLYYRLKGTTDGSGPKNMPPTGGLTPADIADIRDWVQNM